MLPRQAVDAVTADMNEHPATPDPNGLFHTTRHTALLSHLTAQLAAAVEYQLTVGSPDLPPATTLSRTAVHLGRAVAHHAQALDELLLLATSPRSTLQEQVSALDQQRSLRVHLTNAHAALTEARILLHAPPSAPLPPAHLPPRSPALGPAAPAVPAGPSNGPASRW
ncbi:hypothetical protein ACIP93_15345 [Streptomyces sp. NPDC088745]|uniref:hypothetical protein n=1 Tax=Streptomyces sp. NPDC088745 TaxID=3365884 RepID=UPI0037F7B2C5